MSYDGRERFANMDRTASSVHDIFLVQQANFFQELSRSDLSNVLNVLFQYSLLHGEQ